MQVLKAQNVCQALANTVRYINKNGEIEDSRNGRVIVAPEPLCTVTIQSRERVLFSPHRDANPFFHLFEAIWMLSGEDNVTVMDSFIKDFSKSYAETNGALHGAYGARWRMLFGYDQLDYVVQKMIAEPHTRQCVITMWDAYGDRSDDLRGTWKDRPCNTHIYLRNNESVLDMTVCCRSNDMLWGCHGANAVHFSILQEYLAARMDLEIGPLYQISNNAHIYLDQFNKLLSRANPDTILDDRYIKGVRPLAMFDDPNEIDEDIHRFMESFYGRGVNLDSKPYYNKWFADTLEPAMRAHYEFRKKDFERALTEASSIAALDWRMACYEWLERRAK